jgi:hypothetical protein
MQWESTIVRAANFCAVCAARFVEAGYAVQTLRIVTNPFGEYLDCTSASSATMGMLALKGILTGDKMPKGTRIRFAIGAAQTAEELLIVPGLIKNCADLANCCINISCDSNGLPDPALTLAAAQCCAALAVQTDGGEGNFNFTANFNMGPGCPYFPAAYNLATSGANFALGLEYPDLLVAALTPLPPTATWQDRYAALTAAVGPHIATLNGVAQKYAADTSVHFAGFDSSAAPSKQSASMVKVCTLLGLDHFGASGTVQVASFLTRVFKSFGKAQGGTVDLVGFSGFMLACLEDPGLAAAAADGQYDIRALLTYSAVCGIGLDTVPIPGDTPVDKIAALMADTGTMAFRLQKPLTVRLFPCPGKQAGQLTTFTSADLCNCAVFAVP